MITLSKPNLLWLGQMNVDKLIEKGLDARRESKHVEFKTLFDPSSREAWCELVKDIVAMANSGGGVILIGLNNDGTPSGATVNSVLEIDPAIVTDKINRYTGCQFTEYEIRGCQKGEQQVVAIAVGEVSIPLVFQQPGTYPVQGGRQKTAFSKGTVYFRHGAKSEPGTTEDFRRTIERHLDAVRREWLQGVRKVVQAPPGAQVTVLPPEVVQSTSPSATPIRITDDPNALEYRIVDPDRAYPYRLTELVQETNRRLPRGVEINKHDIMSVRGVYHIDERREFICKLRFSSPLYSNAFVDWLIEHYLEDNDFFISARRRYRERDF